MVKVGGPRPVKAKISIPTRALNTEYQNTTGRPILALVTVVCETVAADQLAYAEAFVKSTPPPDIRVSYAGIAGLGPIRKEAHHLLFAVPIGNYYQVDGIISGEATVTLGEWSEVEL